MQDSVIMCLVNIMNIAFIMPYEINVLKTLDNASHLNLGNFILIGDKKKIMENCFKVSIDYSHFAIYDCPEELEAIDFCHDFLQNRRCDYVAFGKIPASYFNRIMDVKEEAQIGAVEVIDLPMLRHYLFVSNSSRHLNVDFDDKKKAIIQAEALIKALNIKKINAAMITNLNNKTDLLETNIIKMILKDDKFNNINIFDSFTLANLFSINCPNNIYQTHINLLIMRNYETTRIFIDTLRIFTDAKIASILVGGKNYAIDFSETKDNGDILFSLLILNKIFKEKKNTCYQEQSVI